MRKIEETSRWEEDIMEVEQTDKIIGGPGGSANISVEQLANRTRKLKEEIESLVSDYNALIASRPKIKIGEVTIAKNPSVTITDGTNEGESVLNITFPKALDPEDLPNQLKRNKEYAVGDIAYYTGLPSWGYLYCKTAGTTGETVPENLPKNESEELTDGTAVFVLRNISYAYGFTEDKDDSNVWIE